MEAVANRVGQKVDFYFAGQRLTGDVIEDHGSKVQVKDATGVIHTVKNEFIATDATTAEDFYNKMQQKAQSATNTKIAAEIEKGNKKDEAAAAKVEEGKASENGEAPKEEGAKLTVVTDKKPRRAKLTEEEILAMIAKLQAGEKPSVVAKEYKVDPAIVSEIKNFKGRFVKYNPNGIPPPPPAAEVKAEEPKA